MFTRAKSFASSWNIQIITGPQAHICGTTFGNTGSSTRWQCQWLVDLVWRLLTWYMRLFCTMHVFHIISQCSILKLYHLTQLRCQKLSINLMKLFFRWDRKHKTEMQTNKIICWKWQEAAKYCRHVCQIVSRWMFQYLCCYSSCWSFALIIQCVNAMMYVSAYD